MSWLAVDKNGDEWVYEYEPFRDEARDIWRSNYSDNLCELPLGSIFKLTKLKMTWNDEPIKITE